MSPPLRQSASFSVGDSSIMNEKAQGSRIMENQLTSPKRFSDESKDPKIAVLRKKSGFSSFMSGLVGSPKKPIISAPENPVHVTHVGYDSTTGQFTVGASLAYLALFTTNSDFIGSTERMAATDQRERNPGEREAGESPNHGGDSHIL
jgi:hypothetical protein